MLNKQQKKYYYDIINEALEHEEEPTIQGVYNRFISEYDWLIERKGFHNALIEWLQGLAIAIPYTYCDILELANKAGVYSEDKEDFICENYWNFMALRLQEMFKSEGLQCK